ncbi:hypothetical protein BT69DRAFT_1339909 [Atractiella rhizophila]|nr:hypothetical protein BT69DRAFT_1339909 [Atractiella rhizophila]
MFALWLSLLLFALSRAQDFPYNVTDITGTWCSGWGNTVVTGPAFANPLNFTFNPPETRGISYSFTGDGFYEEAQYRYLSNASDPSCPKVILIWQHGTYNLHSNQSITTLPIPEDGRIRIDDPCAGQTSTVYYYNEPGLYTNWTITISENHQQYMLQLARYDGALLPRMYLTYKPPMMYPPYQITTNITLADQSLINQYTNYGKK